MRLLVFAVAWGADRGGRHRARRRPAHHDGVRLRRLARARSVRGGRAGADRRGGRQGPRRAPHLRRPRGGPSTDRSTASSTAALIGAGFAFTENIQYFAHQLHRGRRGRCGDDVLRPRHPLAVRPRDVHQRDGPRARPRGAPRSPRRRGARTVGARADRRDRAARASGTAPPSSATSSGSTWRCRCRCSSCSSSASWRCGARRRGSPEARLGDYAAAGWFTPQEVDMLATSAGRRAALAWARTLRGDRTALMKGFIIDATALAAARQRAHHRARPAGGRRRAACCSPAPPPRAPRCSRLVLTGPEDLGILNSRLSARCTRHRRGTER